MKIRRKPDFLTLLAIVTLLGVLISSLFQWYVRRESVLSYRTSHSILREQIRQQNSQLYKGNFIKISSQSSSRQ